MKSPLKKSGINKLEKIMLANKDHYNQNATYACGSELCAAGFCLLLKLGQEEFDKQKDAVNGSDAIRAGEELLGLKRREGVHFDPPIFNFIWSWPKDLRLRFLSLKTSLGRVRFYIRMLRERVDKNGDFTEK